MNRIVILVAALSMAGCAGTYKPTFEHAERVEPISVHVIPVVTKEEMDVQIVVSDSSAVSGQYGLIGAMVGAVIDSAINRKNAIAAEVLAEVTRELTQEYDIIAAAKQSVEGVGGSERWRVLMIEDPVSTVGWDDIANNAFDAGEAEAVVVLDYDYALTPAANQVRVNVDQRVYLRSTEKKGGKNRKAESLRSFTYYSPQVTLVARPYNDGEKDEILELVREEYGERIAARPEEKDDLEKAMEKQLEEIQESDTIPLPRAMRESWTPELLAKYLDESTQHIAFMLRHDWETATVPEDQAIRTEDTYMTINANGMAFTDKGKDVGQLDANQVYRSQWGHMYSVPITE